MFNQKASWLSTAAIFISSLIYSTLGGTLKASGAFPINPTVTNKAKYSDYTFTFTPETGIAVGSILEVVYPSQYLTGLGIPLSPTCSIPCTLSGFKVVFTFTSAVPAGTQYQVTIRNILNPTTKGGTGNFQLTTYSGQNRLDQNLAFGVIGISDDPTPLATTIAFFKSGSSSTAGDSTIINFQFKNVNLIPTSSYFRFLIQDTDFAIASTPVCGAYAINGYTVSGTLSCTFGNNQITMTGLSADIPAKSEVGLYITVTNPKYAQLTETFSILILNPGTNLIAQEGLRIPGLTINPGRISNIQLSPIDTGFQARNKVQDYRLQFKLTNPLSLGNVITISFPESMTLSTINYNYIDSGLDDVSEFSTVGMYLDGNNVITISNFASFTVTPLIVLRLRITNPDTAGTTTPIGIQSFTDSTLVTLIDSDLRTATTAIFNIPSGSNHFITSATFTAGTLIDTLEFNMIPSVFLPVGSTLVFVFPTNITLSIMTTSNCLVKTYGGSYVAPTSCAATGNTVTIVLNVPFVITGINNVAFTNNTTPQNTNGTFLIDITTYASSSSNPTESWTDPLTTTSRLFTGTSNTITCLGQGRQSLLRFVFTNTVLIPAAVPQASALQRKGNIEFEFLNSLNNLGFVGAKAGKVIPCKATNLIASTTTGVACYLYPGAPTAVIKVDGFIGVTAGTTVTIEFAGITHPTNNYQVKIKSTYIYNRIKTELNYVIFNIVPLVPLGYYESVFTNPTSNYIFTPVMRVTSTTQIQFRLGNTNPMLGPATLIIVFPNYDTGWFNTMPTVCKVGTSSYTCNFYPLADWITITIPFGQNILVGETVTIGPVNIPRYSIKYLIPLARFIRSSHEVWYKYQQQLPAALTPAFISPTLICNNLAQGAVNVQIGITLQNLYFIPDDAVIRITFPTGYNLLASDPLPTVTTRVLQPLSSDKPISYTLGISSLDVYNLKAIPVTTAFNIFVNGVKSPSFLTVSWGWVAEIYYQNYQMVYHFGFGMFTFQTENTPNYVGFNSIQAFPSNAGLYAKYTFTFTINSYLASGSYVYVTFPSTDYLVLPTPPTCIVSGALTSFSTCTLTGTTYAIKMNSDFAPGIIQLQILNVLNPSAGVTDGFLIETKYDGVSSDITDTSTLVGRTVTITKSPNSISMRKLNLDPQNEGEPGTYTFSFLVSSPLSSTMGIIITFPNVFDDKLGTTISCESTSGLTGDITCVVAEKAVTVSGFGAYIPDSSKPITIKVYGVSNPNYILGSDTGQFSISTFVLGTNNLIDNTNYAGTLQTVAAPGWSILRSISPSSLFCRISTSYQFTFQNKAGLPSTIDGGKILVLFPTQFDLPDGNLFCDTDNLNFASSLTCSVTRNTVAITGQTSSFSGTLTFNLRGLANPIFPGITDEIVLKTYDSFGSKVLERSFRNLDTFAFTYSYPGPLIQVNADNPIICVRGTQTVDLAANLTYPSSLELTISPTVTGISVVPQSFKFTLGITKTTFRISVPQNYPVGTYYIKWTTQGDQNPPFYTPIKKSQVVVTSQTGLLVRLGTPFAIPYGGNSLPNTISLPLGPDVGVSVKLRFGGDYPGLSFDQSTVSFSPGETSGTYTIFYSNESSNATTSGTILLSLAGENSGVYTLQYTSIPFTVITQDLIAPIVRSATVNNITMNSATLNLVVSEICVAYYMIALERTATPPFSEVFSRGPAPYLTTSSVYGSAIIGATFRISIQLSSLVAETGYVVFIYLQDRGSNPSEVVQLNFKTNNRYNAVNFNLRLLTASPTPAEIQVAINSVAFVLSLPASKIQEKKFNTRLLQEEEEVSNYPSEENDCCGLNIVNTTRNLAGTTTITLQLMAVPDSTLYPSPQGLITLLNTKKTQLASLMSYYDPSINSTATNFVRYTPNFNGYPAFASGGYANATFKVSLDQYGYMFVSIVKKNLTGDNIVPSSYQIWRGFDYQNVAVPSGSVLCSETYADFLIQVEGLEAETTYIAYFIGGSVHPGYPDLMSSDTVASATFTTTAAPTDIVVDDSAGERFVPIAGSILLILLSIIYA